MSDSREPTLDPRAHRYKEYEDPHYHDEDELPGDDNRTPNSMTEARRQAVRKATPRRHYDD